MVVGGFTFKRNIQGRTVRSLAFISDTLYDFVFFDDDKVPWMWAPIYPCQNKAQPFLLSEFFNITAYPQTSDQYLIFYVAS